MEHPGRVTEDTQQAIADDLGVSQKTVDRAIDKLEESGKLSQVTELNTDEKREQVREPGDREVWTHYWVQYPVHPIRT
jgi:DNA-binding MarR family transcriptional regulator